LIINVLLIYKRLVDKQKW